MFSGRDVGMQATAVAPREEPSIAWWLLLLQGIALVIIGILLWLETGVTLFTLVLFTGIYWLIGGIFDLVRVFTDHTGWGWRLVTAVIGVVAGIVVIRHPVWAAVLVPTLLAWLLGAFGVVIGLVTLYRAVTGAGWGAGILGAISLVLGVLLLLNPFFSALVLVYAAATWAIIGGIVSIVWAFRLRSLEQRGPETPPVHTVPVDR